MIKGIIYSATAILFIYTLTHLITISNQMTNTLQANHHPLSKTRITNEEHAVQVNKIEGEAGKHSYTSEIIAEMSIDEKIGQMIMAGISGTSLNENMKKLITSYRVGGLIFYEDNLRTPSQSIQLLNQLKAENVVNRLPLFLSIDQEGGRISKLPGNLIELPINQKIGRVNSPKLSHTVGSLLGKEVKMYGFNVDYAPVLDVNSNPNNPIIGDRSYSHDPNIVGKLGVETMRGIQSQGIISVIKHFPGHGDTSVDSHLDLPKLSKSKQDLMNLELVPFIQAIETGADMVMVAHVHLPKLDESYPATLSKSIINDLLREELDFQGVVITDDLTMKAITNNFAIEAAAIQSVKAGSDIVMVAHNYNSVVSVANALKEAVLKGDIGEERINESVMRIIQLKDKYRLNPEPINAIDNENLNQEIDKALRKYIN